MCSWIEGACVRGSSPSPGPRLPFGSSFSLVSGGATLKRLFLLPGALCGRGGAGVGRLGQGRRRSEVLLSSLPASPPHSAPPARPSVRPSVRSLVRLPARGPFWRSPGGARARELPFSGFRGEGARGPAARGPGRARAGGGGPRRHVPGAFSPGLGTADCGWRVRLGPPSPSGSAWSAGPAPKGALLLLFLSLPLSRMNLRPFSSPPWNSASCS